MFFPRFALFALLATGCAIHAVNPHPSVVVGAGAARFSLDVSAVTDEQKLVGTAYTVKELRRTLENGLHNAAGDKFAPDAADAVVLKFSSVDFGIDHAVGNFISARFRARWIAPDGKSLAEVAGRAQPRNPFESNPQRHLEDVIEVMFEKLVEGYDRATRPAAPAPAGAAF